MVEIKPSPEQAVILHHVANNQDHLLIEAVAGAGKTTTLRQIYGILDDNQKDTCRFLAFNEAIARELEQKGLPARTFHAECFDVLKKNSKNTEKLVIDENKIMKSINAINPPLSDKERRQVKALVSRAKTYGVAPDEKFLDETTWPPHALQGLQYDKKLLEHAKRTLEQSNDAQSIDYNDMLYLPYLKNLSFDQYNLILVDEVQDFNLLQHKLLSKMLKEGGRIIAVGDAQQAIYAFRGALPHSIGEFKKVFKPKCLPLSVTWRCPKGHVEKIKKDLKEFERFQCINASEQHGGDDIPKMEFEPDPRPGDLIIAHSNTNVISIFQKLLEGDQKVKPTGYHAEEVLDQYLSSKYNNILSQKSFDNWSNAEKNLRQSMDPDDTCLDIEALKAMVGAFGQVDVEKIHELLKAPDNEVVRISTIHRSKGLEADRVWLVGQDDLLKKSLNTADPQRANLYYVAMTRAKNTLRFVTPSAFGNNISDKIYLAHVNESRLIVKANPWSRNYQNSWIRDNGCTETGICTGLETYQRIVDQCLKAREQNLYVYAAEKVDQSYIIRSFGKVGDVTPTGRIDKYNRNLYFIEFTEVRGVTGSHDAGLEIDGASYIWHHP